MHFIFLVLVVLNLVAGFRALGTLMAVGLMMVPARVAQAFAPMLFGMALDHAGAAALWLTTLLGLAALAALWLLRPVTRA